MTNILLVICIFLLVLDIIVNTMYTKALDKWEKYHEYIDEKLEEIEKRLD